MENKSKEQIISEIANIEMDKVSYVYTTMQTIHARRAMQQFADQETAELRAENEQLRADNAILLKWQTSGGKCQCTESTGWTTVKCCNICGLPVPGEPWNMPEMERLRAELERVRKEREWINRNMRTPDTDKQVLVMYHHGSISPEIKVEIDVYNLRRERFGREFDWSYVTHWMPLPEPPKE
jgi:hypothetical protein